MSKRTTETYQLDKFTIEVSFAEFVVSLDFTSFERAGDLKLMDNSSPQLIPPIKKRYHELFGEDLRIKNDSFVAEIWGHLLAYRMALWMKRNIKLLPIQKLAKFLAFRSGIADCGEYKVDSNRWIWDVIGYLFF